MKKNIKFRKTNSFRKRRYNKKKNKFIYNKNYLIKYLSLIFLSIIFVFMHIQFKAPKELKKLKKNLIHQIHIAISTDNRYVYPYIVSLTSLLDNRNESTFYIIHVLFDNNFSKNNIDKIKTVVDNFGKNRAEVVFHNIGVDFKKANLGCFGRATYYRIALPSLLPDVNRIIYFDGDTLNLKDLTEMYNIKLNEGMYLSAILDNVRMVKEIAELGIKINKYVNAGVLLMDLKTMREKSIEKILRDFIDTHFLKTVDQTAINAMCNKNIQIMSYKYVVPPLSSYEELVKCNSGQETMYKVSESELYNAYHDPTLIHFFGPGKLWNKNCNHTYKPYWFHYAKMSGFYNEILNHFRYDINEAENILKRIPPDGGLLKHYNIKLM